MKRDNTSVNTQDFQPEPGLSKNRGGVSVNSPTAPLTLSPAHVATAKSLRRAIAKEDFPEPALRILDVLVWLSHESSRQSALIPKQILFAILCGKLSKGKISETLDWLQECKVVVRADYEVNYGGRRRWWTLYTLEIPEKWRLVKPKDWAQLLPARVADSLLVRDVEQWLAHLDVTQKELLPPPPSVDELLREDFVERAGTSFGTGHGGPSLPSGNGGSRVESAERETVDRAGSPERGLGGVESKSKPEVPVPVVSHKPMVPSEGTNVQTEACERAAKVPSGGTSPVPSQGTGAFGSPAGNSPGSLPGNFVGGRGELESRYSSREVRTNNSSRVQARASEEVPQEGTKATRKGAWNDFLSDPYIREKLSRCPGLSNELVNEISRRDGRYSRLGRQFGELYSESPQVARSLLAEAITKPNTNGWLNRAVRVALELEEMPRNLE